MYTTTLKQCLLLCSVVSGIANAQVLPPQEVLAACHYMGQAVGQIKAGRDAGVPDSRNEAVHAIKEISAHVKMDILAQVSPFLDKTENLSAEWVSMLYTHSCAYQYDQELAQVALIAMLIPRQCDAQMPDVRCLQQVYLTLPSIQAI